MQASRKHVRPPCDELDYVYRHSSHMPTTEIDRVISWHRHAIEVSQQRINDLRQIKQGRIRAIKHKEKMNALAALFYERDHFNTPPHLMIQIIQQRLGCDIKRAEHVFDILKQWVKRKKRIDRDRQIGLLSDSGQYTAIELARKFSISRQMVSRIIKKHREQRFVNQE